MPEQPVEISPETDAGLRERETERGRLASLAGFPRDTCPWDTTSLLAKWWFEGFDQFDPKEGS